MAAAPGDPPVLIDHPMSMQRWSESQRQQGHTIALVPTMGALHDGHLQLIDLAHRVADVVVVSIFVNPLQFNRTDDFDTYPRPLDADIQCCERRRVDAVFAPTPLAMYPPSFQTVVEPGDLAERFEGAGRPGHFQGMATVVNKLFNAVKPHTAIFGQKDAQQLAIVRQMVADFDMGIEIVAVPTIREVDGLAMSSRNRRLDANHRRAAVCLSQGLSSAAKLWAAGERHSAVLGSIVQRAIVAEPLARVEYVEVVDPTTFLPANAVIDDHRALIVVAAWFDDVRLIDNWLSEPPTAS